MRLRLVEFAARMVPMTGRRGGMLGKRRLGKAGGRGMGYTSPLLPAYFTVELYSSSLSLAWLAAWSSAAFALEILPVINCSIAA